MSTDCGSGARRRRFKSYLIALTGIVGILAATVAVRTSLRLYALNKILRIPGARQRLQVMPTNKLLAASAHTNEVNLGYAKFSTAFQGVTSVEIWGSSGEGLLITNEQFQLTCLPPFAPKLATSLPSQVSGYPRLGSYLMKIQTDPVAWQIETEQFREAPILKLVSMSRDEFLLYSRMLADKASCRRGRSEVYSFTTPSIKGIVRIGDSPQDRRVASASIVSRNGLENLGFHLYLVKKGGLDITQVLDDILGSFHFTTDTVADPAQVRELISSAGIRRRDHSQADVPRE